MTPPEAPSATPTTPTFARIRTATVPIGQLREHPQHLDMPMDTEAFEALCQDVHAKGVTNRLLVSASEDGFYEVLAGNQRLKAAKVVGLAEIPVEVIDADDPVSVMLADNVLGRARTKSAIALQVFMYYREDLVSGEAAEAKKAQNLKKGSSPMPNIRHRGNIGVSARSLSEKYGFNAQLLNDLADIWRKCHEGGDLKESMAHWGKVVDAISSGNGCTSRVKAGMGGRVSTLGKKRGSTDWGGLAKTSTVTLGNVWKNWDQITITNRADFMDAFHSALEHIPEDGVIAITETLSKWPERDIKRLAYAAAEHLGYRIKKPTKKNKED